jgi:hypothetical protein
MKKTRNCLICTAPTVADNKLCKNPECLKEQLKRRMHIVHEEDTPRSGVYLSLTLCTHGKSLEIECAACEREWKQALREN